MPIPASRREYARLPEQAPPAEGASPPGFTERLHLRMRQLAHGRPKTRLPIPPPYERPPETTANGLLKPTMRPLRAGLPPNHPYLRYADPKDVAVMGPPALARTLGVYSTDTTQRVADPATANSYLIAFAIPRRRRKDVIPLRPTPGQHLYVWDQAHRPPEAESAWECVEFGEGLGRKVTDPHKTFAEVHAAASPGERWQLDNVRVMPYSPASSMNGEPDIRTPADRLRGSAKALRHGRPLEAARQLRRQECFFLSIKNQGHLSRSLANAKPGDHRRVTVGWSDAFVIPGPRTSESCSTIGSGDSSLRANVVTRHRCGGGGVLQANGQYRNREETYCQPDIAQYAEQHPDWFRLNTFFKQEGGQVLDHVRSPEGRAELSPLLESPDAYVNTTGYFDFGAEMARTLKEGGLGNLMKKKQAAGRMRSEGAAARGVAANPNR